MPAIYREDLAVFVYCSRATAFMRPADVSKILRAAKQWNPKMDITGSLTYGGGMFLQWLEGPHHFVHELKDRIKKDPRHDCVLPLYSMLGVEERMYPDWTMELVPPSDIQTVLRQTIEKTSSTRHIEAIKLLLSLIGEGPLKPLVT